MSLAIVGFATILLTLVIMVSRKLSPSATLVVVPVIAVFVAGFAGLLDFGAEVSGFLPILSNTVSKLSSFIVSGVTSVSSTTVMFIFAVVFFNAMMDAGAFDPILNAAIKVAGNSPVKILVVSVIVAIIGHLDGNGVTTVIVTCTTMVPIYKRMRMNMLNLAVIIGLTAGLMNIMPWGGPLLRVMTAYNASMAEVFNPLIIPFLFGLAAIFAVAVWMGRQEKKRLDSDAAAMAASGAQGEKSGAGTLDRDESLLRPKNAIFNLCLIVFTVVAMVLEWLAPCPAMMIASVIALFVNFPDQKVQAKLIAKYGGIGMSMAVIMFSAGVFTGVLNNSGMLMAMAETMANAIPASLGKLTPILVGIVGVPASMAFSPDSWYYSILPTITTATAGVGVDALSVGRAALLGQQTMGFMGTPLYTSPFLVSSMCETEFPEYQKKWFPYAWGISILMIVVGLFSGCIIL